MKDRLPSLDGLRGFAALSVVFSHAGWGILGSNAIPILPIILAAFSGGHGAVQILFVLSGFLMAFLYPETHNAITFIKKRYARIFPIYGTIVLFIWISYEVLQINSWYVQIIILACLALFVHFSWRFIKKNVAVPQILFYAFIVLQITVLFFNFFLAPHFESNGSGSSHIFWQVTFNMLANLTLTAQYGKLTTEISPVFWSLGAEILFYILYPFLVVPLIQIAKKRGIIISIIIVLAITKILLDLDGALASIASLQGMNIARANGFVAGVTIGTIYQSQGKTWKVLYAIAKHRMFGVFSLLLLFAVQTGETFIGSHSIPFMNIYYLIASWFIGIAVINAIIPNTLLHKIFKIKYLTFLGVISYSVYLIHMQVLGWAATIENFFSAYLSIPSLHDILFVILVLVITISISYFLFMTIEILYFSSKKSTLATTQASYAEKVREPYKGFSHTGYAVILLALLFIFGLIYAGSYSPTLFVHRNSFSQSNLKNNTEVMLNKNVATIPFISAENNLSVVQFNMLYDGSAGVTVAKIKNPAVLKFELFDAKNKLLFSSNRHAYVIEGSPRFQFGFPTIVDSKGEKYIVKLSVLKANKQDQAIINTSSDSFVTIYTTTKSALLHQPWNLIINRIIFTFSNPNYLFFVAFLLFLLSISYFYSSIKPKRNK